MNNMLEIRKTLEIFKDGQLVEVRSVAKPGMSGYFRDVENLLRCVEAHPSETFYFVLNEISEQCYAKEQREMLKRGATSATSDMDIEYRKWVLVDADPARSSGVSASKEEKRKTMAVIGHVHDYLRDAGFSEPVVADSGNGYHLLYNVHMKNKPENTEIVKSFLAALDMLFSDDAVKIDTSVYNASRITKLYGVIARKGASTEDRPHRLSRLLRVPQEVKPTSAELLKKVASVVPEPVKPNYKTGYAQFDIRDFIQRNGVHVAKEVPYGNGTKFVLSQCPFNPEHKAPDSAIFETSSGAIGFKCFHNSCSGHNWHSLRELYDPGIYERKAEQSRTTQPMKHEDKSEMRQGDPFKQLHEINYRDRSKLVTIQSGFNALDKKLIGFNKGELSVWSGGNGAGKSTMLTQLAIDSVQQGFKVAIFSGELRDNRVKEWAHLQAAGRQFTIPTKYDGVYYVSRMHGDLIDEWCKGNLWIYDNDYGSSFTGICDSLQQKITKDELDVIVIDNLMSLDLRDLPGDKWERQTEAASKLHKLAEKRNVHIHFVCHPKKENGFLRKNDISGSGDLSNIADNVFMAHRVNRDFRRGAEEFFGKVEAPKYFEFDNVIECMKNRDLGVSDYITGLYFEKESKRYLNQRYENKTYGWVDLIPKDDWVMAIEKDITEGAVETWQP